MQFLGMYRPSQMSSALEWLFWKLSQEGETLHRNQWWLSIFWAMWVSYWAIFHSKDWLHICFLWFVIACAQVWDNWTGGTITEIVDSFLHYNCAESEALKCIHIGLLCVQENPGDRPSMSNVILMLVGRSTTLSAPSRPAFLFRLNNANHVHHEGANELPEGSNKSNSSFNKVTITELEPR